LPAALSRVTSGPAGALGLPVGIGQLQLGGAADITLFDPAQACEIGRNWLSRGSNCPFIGQGAPAAVTHTLHGGKLVYQLT
jgi:dihydroorotase